jgi:hypothetical protein
MENAVEIHRITNLINFRSIFLSWRNKDKRKTNLEHLSCGFKSSGKIIFPTRAFSGFFHSLENFKRFIVCLESVVEREKHEMKMLKTLWKTGGEREHKV